MTADGMSAVGALTRWAERLTDRGMRHVAVADRRNVVLSYLLLLAVFNIDLLTPRGIAVGVLHIVPVLVSTLTGRSIDTLVVASVASVLVVTGGIFSPKSVVPLDMVVVHRVLSLIAIWSTAGLGLRLWTMRSNLRDRQNLLTGIVDSVADGIMTIDSRGRIILFNNAAQRLFDRNSNEIIGSSIAPLLAPPFDTTYPPRIIQACLEGVPESHRTTETMGRRRDGSTFPMQISFSRVTLDNKCMISAVMRDISSEREIDRHVLNAIAQEQQRIARDLHDGIGQELTALHMLASTVHGQAPDHPAAPQMLRIAQIAQEAVEDARALIRGIHPPALDEGDLAQAIDTMVRNACHLTHVRYHLYFDPAIHFTDRNVILQLYYIAREAVNNAIRHAQAHNLHVRLEQRDHLFLLNVHDDGVGLPAKVKAGHGLQTMHYRARSVGACLDITSEPDQGTTVALWGHLDSAHSSHA
jgi:PAS domain S-box-containing protein